MTNEELIAKAFAAKWSLSDNGNFQDPTGYTYEKNTNAMRNMRSKFDPPTVSAADMIAEARAVGGHFTPYAHQDTQKIYGSLAQIKRVVLTCKPAETIEYLAGALAAERNA